MIVISKNLTLTASPSAIADITGNNPIVGYKSVLAVDDISATQENENYPIANVIDPSTFSRWQGVNANAFDFLANISTIDDLDFVGIANHNLMGRSIKLEGSTGNIATNYIRNNTMIGAIAGSPGTLPDNWGGDPSGVSLTQEIVGIGQEGNIDYIDIRLSGTPTGDFTYILDTPTDVIDASQGEDWTISAYLKLIGGDFTNVSGLQLQILERDNNPATVETNASTNLIPTTSPLFEQRFAFTAELQNATTEKIIPALHFNFGGGVGAIDITIRIGWPQVEKYHEATEAIKTAGETGSQFIYSEIVQETVISDNSPIILRFEPQSFANIRVRLSAGTSTPYVAVVYVGKLLILMRRIYVNHKVMNYNRKVRTQTSISENGNFLGRVVMSETVESSLELGQIFASYYREKMDDWIKMSAVLPFFFAWRPEQYPNEVAYSWVPNGSNPEIENEESINEFVRVSMALEGIV